MVQRSSAFELLNIDCFVAFECSAAFRRFRFCRVLLTAKLGDNRQIISAVMDAFLQIDFQAEMLAQQRGASDQSRPSVRLQTEHVFPGGGQTEYECSGGWDQQWQQWDPWDDDYYMGTGKNPGNGSQLGENVVYRQENVSTGSNAQEQSSGSDRQEGATIASNAQEQSSGSYSSGSDATGQSSGSCRPRTPERIAPAQAKAPPIIPPWRVQEQQQQAPRITKNKPYTGNNADRGGKHRKYYRKYHAALRSGMSHQDAVRAAQA